MAACEVIARFLFPWISMPRIHQRALTRYASSDGKVDLLEPYPLLLCNLSNLQHNMEVFEKSETVDPEVRAYIYSLVSAVRACD